MPVSGPGLVTVPITYCPGEWPHAHCPGCGSQRIVYGFDGEQGGWVWHCDQCEAQDSTPKRLVCVYCGENATLRNHLIPLRLGGGVVVPSCWRCNREKLNMVPGVEYLLPQCLLIFVQEEAARIQKLWWDLHLDNTALWWLEVRRTLWKEPLLFETQP